MVTPITGMPDGKWVKYEICIFCGTYVWIVVELILLGPLFFNTKKTPTKDIVFLVIDPCVHCDIIFLQSSKNIFQTLYRTIIFYSYEHSFFVKKMTSTFSEGFIISWFGKTITDRFLKSCIWKICVVMYQWIFLTLYVSLLNYQIWPRHAYTY